MTSRERVKKAIALEKPDITPVDYWVLPSAYLEHGKKFVELLKKYPKDFSDALDVDQDNLLPPSHRKGEYEDCFGSVWRQEYDGFLGQVVKYPLADLEAVETHVFPDPAGGEISVEQLRNIVSRFRGDERFICVDSIRTFERMHFMRGMENLFMDFAYGRPEFNRLLDRVVEWNMAHLRLALDELKDGIDGVTFSDDWGAQSALFIRPESWRQIFKPRYKEMFDLVKSYGGTVLFHSDGYILDIIGDLIEAGADAINCQVKLMGAARLAEQFGGRVAFHTDLDRQNILPFGTKDDIRRHVEDVVEHLGRFSGGLILCAEIGHDMPFENIEFLVGEFDRVRRL